MRTGTAMFKGDGTAVTRRPRHRPTGRPIAT
jgi:hypothetical protein